jgi:hypothetical protein
MFPGQLYFIEPPELVDLFRKVESVYSSMWPPSP